MEYRKEWTTMKKQLVSWLAAVCLLVTMVAASLTVSAGTTAPTTPTMPTTEVAVNLSELTTEVDNADYKVTSSTLFLKRRDVTYVLSGSTTKIISFANNPTAYESKAYSLVLNGVTCGNVTQGNYKGWTINVKLADNTTNTTGYFSLYDLYLFGKGTLKPTLISNSSNAKLTITDAKVEVDGATCEWDGTVLLNGDADVTIKAKDVYEAVKLGQQTAGSTLTLDGNAKLTCTHQNPDTEVAASVNGLSAFNGAILTVKGNSTLTAYAMKSSIGYDGAAIMVYNYDFDTQTASGTLKLADNGCINATAYDYSAVLAVDIEITGGTVNATCNEGAALFSTNSMTVEKAVLNLTNSANYYNLVCNNAFTVSDSWVNASISQLSSKATVTDSVIILDKAGEVYGDAVLPRDVTLPAGYTMEINFDNSLTVPTGVTFTNHGAFTLYGSFVNNGTVICDCHCDAFGSSAATGTYWKACRLCEYTGDAKALPDITWVGGDRACRDTDFTMTVKVSGGLETTIKVYRYDPYEEMEMTVTAVDGGYRFVIPGEELPEGTSFDIVVTVTMEDGFESSHVRLMSAWDHAGGSASCTHKAECTNCGNEYGDVNPDAHGELVYVEAKAATLTEEGNIAYWYCPECLKRFADENATRELTVRETVLPKLTSGNNGSNTGNLPGNSEGNEPGSPATGEHTDLTVWWVLLAVAGVAIVAVVVLTVCKKRKSAPCCGCSCGCETADDAKTDDAE